MKRRKINDDKDKITKSKLSLDSHTLKKQENVEEESVVRLTAGVPQSKHERLLDLQWITGLTMEQIVQQALDMLLDEKNPPQRPKEVRENRKKMGRPPKRRF